MKIRFRRVLSALLAAAVSTGALAGCQQRDRDVLFIRLQFRFFFRSVGGGRAGRQCAAAASARAPVDTPPPPAAARIKTLRKRTLSFGPLLWMSAHIRQDIIVFGIIRPVKNTCIFTITAFYSAQPSHKMR